VSAVAKTYAHFYSTWATDETGSLKVNGYTTGEFIISSTNVLDAVDKINAISGSTGVTASATSDYKVRLYASSGKDIVVENEKALTSQRIAAVSHDGTSVKAAAVQQGIKVETGATIQDNAEHTYYILNAETGEKTSVTFTAGDSDQGDTLTALNTALGQLSGKWGTGGDYHLTVAQDAASTTKTRWTNDSSGSMGDFKVFTDSTYTTSLLADVDDTTYFRGDRNTSDLNLLAQGGTTDQGSAGGDGATIQGTISLPSSKIFGVTQSGTELAANDNYFTTGAASLSTVSNVDLRTQAKASDAIAVLDGAIEKISSMRSDLGAIENRLSHTVSNLMNVAENTSDAKSRINDADYSKESANLARAQVLQQAGTAMLAQANARSQLVLQLLQ